MGKGARALRSSRPSVMGAQRERRAAEGAMRGRQRPPHQWASRFRGGVAGLAGSTAYEASLQDPGTGAFKEWDLWQGRRCVFGNNHTFSPLPKAPFLRGTWGRTSEESGPQRSRFVNSNNLSGERPIGDAKLPTTYAPPPPPQKGQWSHTGVSGETWALGNRKMEGCQS